MRGHYSLERGALMVVITKGYISGTVWYVCV